MSPPSKKKNQKPSIFSCYEGAHAVAKPKKTDVKDLKHSEPRKIADRSAIGIRADSNLMLALEQTSPAAHRRMDKLEELWKFTEMDTTEGFTTQKPQKWHSTCFRALTSNKMEQESRPTLICVTCWQTFGDTIIFQGRRLPKVLRASCWIERVPGKP